MWPHVPGVDTLFWGLTAFSTLSPLFTSAVSGNALVVTGVQTGIKASGERPARRNIIDIYEERGPHWDLFVQAIDLLEKSDLHDWLSYYQIAGIHGLPFYQWGNVGNIAGGNKDSGFCPHGQTTFASWHRPYLVLLEQALSTYATKVAKQYPSSSSGKYIAAAQTLRLPFWDWAKNSTMPPVLTVPTVNYTSPDGPETMENPLHSYTFPRFPFPSNMGFTGLLSQYNETVRCTNTSGPNNGISDMVKSNAVLKSNQKMLTDKVYSFFTQSVTFERMSSTMSKYPSLEDPHNDVHDAVACEGIHGRAGHMGDLGYAAFDPIFWLHHANVDRLLSMWQAIYYNNTYFTTNETAYAIFASDAGTENADSPLKPFFASNSKNFHTTRSVADISTFGYTYPEIDDWSQSRDELADSVRTTINLMYGQSANDTKLVKRQDNAMDIGILKDNDFAIYMEVDRKELPLPASLDLMMKFGGRTYTEEPITIKIGGGHILSMPDTGLTHSIVPLRRLLRDNADIIGSPVYASIDNVVAELQSRMKVVIKAANGTIVPQSMVPSLVARIRQRSFTPAKSADEFPTYGSLSEYSLVN